MRWQWLKKYPELWLLAAAAFLTRFLWLGYPREVVFDEVHFGKFLSAYFKGEPFFDIHPPLGKLLYAFIAWLRDFQPDFAFDHIGQAYTDVPILALRILPAFLGVLLVPLIYFVARELGLRRPGATLAAGFVLLDNALLTQSRFMLLDIPLLFFGFGSILLFLLAEKKLSEGWLFARGAAVGGLPSSVPAPFANGAGSAGRNRRRAPVAGTGEPPALRGQQTALAVPWLLFTASALFLAFAISIKWTALAFFAPLVILYGGIVIRRHPPLTFDLKMLGLFVGLVAFIYAGFFALHFGLTEPKKLQAFPKNFFELQAQMYTANQQDLRHPNESLWYEWPWLKRSVFYWQSAPGGIAVAWIYLLGNPFVWWVSAAGILFGLILPLKKSVGRLWLSARAAAAITLICRGTRGASHLFSRALRRAGLQMTAARREGSPALLGVTPPSKYHLSRPQPVPQKYGGLLLFLVLSYLANLLPFIPITRAMFLYHYFPALIISFMILGVTFDRLLPNEKTRWLGTGVLLLAAFIFFLYFAPLSYGLSLNEAELHARMWLAGWR